MTVPHLQTHKIQIFSYHTFMVFWHGGCRVRQMWRVVPSRPTSQLALLSLRCTEEIPMWCVRYPGCMGSIGRMPWPKIGIINWHYDRPILLRHWSYCIWVICIRQMLLQWKQNNVIETCSFYCFRILGTQQITVLHISQCISDNLQTFCLPRIYQQW